MNWDHPNYSIAKIGKNTEMRSRDSKRLGVTCIQVKDH